MAPRSSDRDTRARSGSRAAGPRTGARSPFEPRRPVGSRRTSGGLAVLGAILGGVLGETIGVRGAIWVGVAGLAIAPLFGLAGPLKRLHAMPTGPG